jgi:hypothetical protein
VKARGFLETILERQKLQSLVLGSTGSSDRCTFPYLSGGHELPVGMHRQARDVIAVAEEEALRVRLRAVHDAHPSSEVNRLVGSRVEEVIGRVGDPAANRDTAFIKHGLPVSQV